MDVFFWGFFAVVLVLYTLVYKKQALRNYYLLAVSLFFYYKTGGVFILLLLFTICSDYSWARLMEKNTSERKRKIFLSCSIVLNLFLLSYFKYAQFITNSVNDLFGTHFQYINHFSVFSNGIFGTHFKPENLILPIGISFFTFQSLSYTIDVYRRKVKAETNILNYGFFVCFFPHLVAGPIVKAHEFLYQLKQPYALSRKEFGLAIFWIMNGYLKKILADYLAVNLIDRMFDNPNYFSGLELTFGIFGYSLQIYMDFSGYTDMAIGIALLLGFHLKTNFNSPYKAQSTSEFWKRWHISLSSWLQEYLYIPLGGNQSGSLGSYACLILIALFLILLSGKLVLVFVFIGLAILLAILTFFFQSIKNYIHTNVNILVTMLLGGLWHGSSWLFIIWGGLNGLGIVLHKIWQNISPLKNKTHIALKIFFVLTTLTFISFTRIFFRSDNMQTVNLIFEKLVYNFNGSLFFKILSGYKAGILVLVAGYLIHWIPTRYKEKYRQQFSELPVAVMAIAVVVLFTVAYQFRNGELQPFIYFQF
jgi:alginate O-acetyltransferase complex protein AlgI